MLSESSRISIKGGAGGAGGSGRISTLGETCGSTTSGYDLVGAGSVLVGMGLGGTTLGDLPNSS